MPTTNKVHTKVEEVTRQEELWDEGIKTSLAHERGVSWEGGLLKYNGRIYVPTPSRASRRNHRPIPRPRLCRTPRHRENEGTGPQGVLVAKDEEDRRSLRQGL